MGFSRLLLMIAPMIQSKSAAPIPIRILRRRRDFRRRGETAPATGGPGVTVADGLVTCWCMAGSCKRCSLGYLKVKSLRLTTDRYGQLTFQILPYTLPTVHLS